MESLKIKVMAGLACVLIGAIAEAREPGFYVGGSVGATDYEVEKSQGYLLLLDGGPFGGSGILNLLPESVEADDGETGYGAMVGYRVNKWLAAELAYTRFGDAEVTERYRAVSFLSPELTDRVHSLKTRGPALSMMVMLPVGNFDLFARGGVLFANYEVSMRGVGGPTDTFGDEVAFGGVGIDWTFAKRWKARIEYQRSAALSATVATGEAKLEHVSASVIFKL